MITNFGYGQPDRLILDAYPQAAAAYSVRKLRFGYTGQCIRIRRSSDNAETDIGFLSSGDIDAAAITSFLGGSNGFLVTWYDQSGSSNNATQSTAARQVRVYTNKLNTKVALGFDSAPATDSRALMDNPIVYSTGGFYSFSVAGSTSVSPAANGCIYGNNAAVRTLLWILRRSSGDNWIQSGSQAGDLLRALTANTVRNSVITDLYDTNASDFWRIYEDGTLITSKNGTYGKNVDMLFGGGPAGVGAAISFSYLILSEQIFFNGPVIAPGAVNSLEDDMKAYYGI